MLDLPNFTHDSYTDRQVSILPDQDILTVKLGDAGARVYRVAPRQLNGRLLADNNKKLNVNLGWQRQFDIYNNYIEFYTDESVEASEGAQNGSKSTPNCPPRRAKKTLFFSKELPYT